MSSGHRDKERMVNPEADITDGYGLWELNLDPLKEQRVFLTTEPSLHCQSHKMFDS